MPAVTPTTEENKSSIGLLVSHGRVLSWWRHVREDLRIRGEDLPVHLVNLKIGRAVDVLTEGSQGSLSVVSLFTTEDEELVGEVGDGFDEDGAVVPSGNAKDEVAVVPLLGLEIEHHHVVEVHLRVPTAINVDFILVTEKRVSTTAGRSLLREGRDSI